MMKCDDVQQMLADYRTENLSSQQRVLIEEHLANCSECAEELRVLDDVLNMVELNVSEYEAPAGLWNGVYNRITDQNLSKQSYFDVIKSWFAVPARAAGVGITAVALIAGVMFGGMQHSPEISKNVVANSEFVQGHALYASRAPLADQISYMTLVAQSSESEVSETK